MTAIFFYIEMRTPLKTANDNRDMEDTLQINTTA